MTDVHCNAEYHVQPCKVAVVSPSICSIFVTTLECICEWMKQLRGSSEPPKKLLKAFAWVEEEEDSWEDVEQDQHYDSQQHKRDVLDAQVVQMTVEVNCIFHHLSSRGIQMHWREKIEGGKHDSGVGEDENSSNGVNDRGTRVDISVHLHIVLVDGPPQPYNDPVVSCMQLNEKICQSSEQQQVYDSYVEQGIGMEPSDVLTDTKWRH